MYQITSSGRDSRGAEEVIITCRACGYLGEHFMDRGLAKVGRSCDRCGR
ncbi:MAG: hypothetical protein OXR67_01260 [Chloroflexota bacterium]|nr:hypothetical protein [Chloroflexota bacterium]